MNNYSKDRLPLVLLAPIVSEKSTMIADKLRQIAFRVAADATKADVKDAVEAMFKEQKVEVAAVHRRPPSGERTISVRLKRAGLLRRSPLYPLNRRLHRLQEPRTILL